MQHLCTAIIYRALKHLLTQSEFGLNRATEKALAQQIVSPTCEGPLGALMPCPPVTPTRAKGRSGHIMGRWESKVLSLAKRLLSWLRLYMKHLTLGSLFQRQRGEGREERRERGRGMEKSGVKQEDTLATSQNCCGSDFYECLTLNLALFSQCRGLGQRASPRGTALIQRLYSPVPLYASWKASVRVTSGNL